MRISELINRKGNAVVTVTPETSLTELLGVFFEHRIGAAIVSADDGASVIGIISERDVVRALHRSGTGVLDEPVGSIMTTEVQTCTTSDELESLAVKMTEHRVRHLPVVEDGHLLAIVSIGDVVKHRLDELQDERNQLLHYVQGDRSTV